MHWQLHVALRSLEIAPLAHGNLLNGVSKPLRFGARIDELKYCVANERITADKTSRNYFWARFGSLPTWRSNHRAMFGPRRAIPACQDAERGSPYHLSTGCQHRCEYRFTGPCLGGPIPGSGIDARYAWVRLPFLEPTKTGAFFVLAARLCPGAIIDPSTLPLRCVREWPSDCFPNPVATPTCFEIPLRFLAGYSGRFAGWRCSVLGYKCQDRRYKAKNRSLKLPPPATRPGPRSISPSCTMSKTFQWDSSGNKGTRGP